jgi:hypothetical protein
VTTTLDNPGYAVIDVPPDSLFTVWWRAEPVVFLAARNCTSRPGFFTDFAPEELREHRLYLGYGGLVGFAISSDGDLQSVFNNGGPRGAGALATRAAVRQGVRTLDRFDGFLPAFYTRFRFRETTRAKFDRALAPRTWDYAAYGEPDVVFMRRGA